MSLEEYKSKYPHHRVIAERYQHALLHEGGAYGHLTHPYEDLSLTFSDIKAMVNDALAGKLKVDEKVDGQNLMFTWKNNQLRAARNKSHLKNRGENALTKDSLDQMFADRPPQVRQAFTTAMSDLEGALSAVNPSMLEEIFQEGKRFMNMEVILPSTQNVIPYGMNLLVFHGTVEYDEAGNPVGQGLVNAGQYLESVVKKVNANIQKHFTLRGPNPITLKSVKNLPVKRAEYMQRIRKIQGTLPDSATLADYHTSVWAKMISTKAQESGYEISETMVNDLIQRWVLGNKSKSITQLRKEITNDSFRTWVQSFDGKQAIDYYKKVNEPIENLFLSLGVEVLTNASGYLASSPDAAARQIAQQTQQEIEKIKQSNDPDAIYKLERELERINRLGGLEKAAGTEGVTFYRNGKVYKLTGLFAPTNAILGMIRYQRK
jgi:hypothetical protein